MTKIVLSVYPPFVTKKSLLPTQFDLMSPKVA